MIYTTLNRIRAVHPCGLNPRRVPLAGYQKLVAGLKKGHDADAPIGFDEILRINGAADAVWCFKAEPQNVRCACLIALKCAELVACPEEDVSVKTAREVIARFLAGDATGVELQEAKNAAAAAAAAAAATAAHAAAYVAAAAAYVAAAAAAAAACAADAADAADAAAYAADAATYAMYAMYDKATQGRQNLVILTALLQWEAAPGEIYRQLEIAATGITPATSVSK